MAASMKPRPPRTALAEDIARVIAAKAARR